MVRPELLRKMTRNEAIWIAPNEELLVLVDERAAGMKLGGSTLEHGVAPYVLLRPVRLRDHRHLHCEHDPGRRLRNGKSADAGRARLRACLDFAGALILVPMMRRLLTWVRSTWLGRVMPVDESVDFHRSSVTRCSSWRLFHAGAFIAAFAMGHTPSSAAGFFESERFLTGGVLIAVFAVMWLFSLSFIRKSQRFELFATTHLLWVAWFVLAIAHAPSFCAVGGRSAAGLPGRAGGAPIASQAGKPGRQQPAAALRRDAARDRAPARFRRPARATTCSCASRHRAGTSGTRSPSAARRSGRR